MPGPEPRTLAIVSSYPPRKCGIATFSKDLHDVLVQDKALRSVVLAMDDVEEGYRYPPEVHFEMQPNELKDYELATDFLNINQFDAVLLQHEYGLFGARSGENIVSLVRDTRMPVITTLHTVLDKPTWEQSTVMRGLLEHSDRLVVMSERGRKILREVYGAAASKIAIIPHGIPDLPFVDPSFYKDRFGFCGKRVLMTFGLLGPGKGIETAIEALPAIVAKRPDVIYVIVGAMHPHVEKRLGRSYIHQLQRLAERLGVSENVVFHNRYVSLEELCAYLGSADIYVTPYPHAHQICSGTLTYAMGAGKAVVSTPFYYAQEMLEGGRGKLFGFNDAGELSRVVLALLENPTETDAMRKAAYTFCRDKVWPEVGAAYRRLAAEVLEERHRSPRRMVAPTASSRRASNLPEISVRQLAALTDDTGMFQHAIYALPNRAHGYCTDDNARALLASMQYWEMTEDEAILPLARRYMSFLLYAYDPAARRFRNFMRYDRRWEESGQFSEDAYGRTLWALGTTVALAGGDELRMAATRLFGEALGGAESLTHPRGWAFALLGIHAYLRHYAGDSFARRTREMLARKLHGRFTGYAVEAWPWSESEVTYDNAVLAQALITTGPTLQDTSMTQCGLAALEWLLRIQTDEHDRLMLIGNQGWYTRGGTAAKFDQQPVEALGLVLATCEALRVTGDEQWRGQAQRCFEWFLGANCIQAQLYDPATGGCRDGLGANGPNENQGAESSLAWLLSLMMMHRIHREKSLGGAYAREGKAALATSNGTK